MKKDIKIILLISVGVVFVGLITIGSSFYIITNSFIAEKQKLDLLESISSKIEILNTVDYCQEIQFVKSEQFKCIQGKKPQCTLKNYSLNDLKKLNIKLEESISKCIKLQEKTAKPN